jgi:hypothetical protein
VWELRPVTYLQIMIGPNPLTAKTTLNLRETRLDGTDHSTAIVPLQCWMYESPLLQRDRTPIDVGLLAEALIYYDRVLLVPVSQVPAARVIDAATATEHQQGRPFDDDWRRSFMELIGWFVARNEYGNLVSLLSDGTLHVYHYAFYPAAVLNAGKYSYVNFQDEQEAQRAETFVPRFLEHRSFDRLVPRARHREKMYRALAGHVTEAHAEDFGTAIENARRDFGDAESATVALQSLLDDLAPLLPATLRGPVAASIVDLGNGEKRLTFNVAFDQIANAVAPLEFGISTPLCGLAHSNRLLWSAALTRVDLFLPSPISRLVNRKLLEGGERRARTSQTIEMLEARIDFPDVRHLVNTGQMSFGDVLRVRRHAQRFRNWLQSEAERDRDALVAYHHEVAQASGFHRVAGKTLRMFGLLAGAGVGAKLAESVGGISMPERASTIALLAAVSGKAGEEALKFVFDLAGKLDEDWKPVVFGDWLRAQTDVSAERP